MLARLRILLCCLLAVTAGPALHAQTWPAKPIRIIVPFAPGGPADLLPQLIGPKLTEAWGQPVVLKLMAGIDIVHVPYNGTAPALRDLLGGQITFMFAQTSAALPQVQAGKLRALGVASLKRTAQLPDLPTVAESGLPGFEAVSWYALLAPAGTPKEIIVKLQSEIARILQLPDIRERLGAQGGEGVGNAPEQLNALLRAESSRYADIVKRANIKAE